MGVSENASNDEIKKKYRALALKYHPDKNSGDQKSEEVFKEATEAYETLSNPEKRRVYDDTLKFGTGNNFNNFNQNTNFGGIDLDDLFSKIYQNQKSFNYDVHREVLLPFLLVVKGGEFSLEIKDENNRVKEVKVKLPSGLISGERIRVPKMGNGIGKDKGDLYLTIFVQPHEFYNRDGNDLYLPLPLTLKEAMLGALVGVPDINGKTSKVKINPNTQNGHKLRLKGKGVKRGREVGDLILICNVLLPEKISKNLRKALEETEQSETISLRDNILKRSI